MVSKKTCFALLAAAACLLIAVIMLLPPIPQPQEYHNFADHRSLLGLANALNVLSNIPIALAGIYGIMLLLVPGKAQLKDPRQKLPWLVISVGLILTAAGSGYYHLSPDNDRLVWDRLPMTLVFMSLTAVLIGERICVRLGLLLWPFLVILGFASVLYWHSGEQHGTGDLRFYLGIQAFTFLTLLIVQTTPSCYTRSGDLTVIAFFYGLAVLSELYDTQIFAWTDGTVSGHTIKHLAVAMAALWMMLMIGRRKIIDDKCASTLQRDDQMRGCP